MTRAHAADMHDDDEHAADKHEGMDDEHAADKHDEGMDKHDEGMDKHDEGMDKHDEGMDKHDEGMDEHGDDRHHDHSVDPHVWLSPPIMRAISSAITTALVARDPHNGDDYQRNGDELIANLDALHRKYQVALSTCAHNIIISDHNVFGYMAEEYRFQTITMHGLAPEVETTADRLATIIERARAENIEYILYTAGSDTRTIQTVADEAGIALLPFYALEFVVLEDATYIEAMELNLANLKLARACE